jgi:hypothetical protein
MNKYSLMRQLPKVGERRLEAMTILRERRYDVPPEPCVVIEVNVPHLWYRVRFDRTGWCECYKLPHTKPLSWEVGE